jgi:hypothetical protein
MGAACPLERINSSPGPITEKNKALIISAQERHEVGCPDPAEVVESSEAMRNLLAMSVRSLIGVTVLSLAHNDSKIFSLLISALLTAASNCSTSLSKGFFR